MSGLTLDFRPLGAYTETESQGVCDMRFMANLFARSVWILLVALLPAGLTPAQGQSLGDVARKNRKERTEKRSPASPPKVFTNEDIDLRRVVIPGESSIDPQNPEAGARVLAPATATAEGGEQLSEEEQWRDRFGHARYYLERSQRELSVLKDKLQINQVQYSSDPTRTLMQEYTRSNVTGVAEEIREKEQEVVRHQKAIRDLEDELRRARGNFGWSRTSPRAPVTARTAAAASAPKVNPNELPQDEDYWRDRFTAARAKVEEARRDQALLEDELMLTMTAAARIPDPAERLRQHQAGIESRRMAVERHQVVITQAEEDLDELTEDFRATGLPRAWSEPE